MKALGKMALVWLIFQSTAYSTIDSDLSGFFDDFSVNVTHAEAYHGQSAGYYTGGSVFERHTVKQTPIVAIELPSARAGCGGIDLFTGGFSYVNSQEFVQALKNIANNATSYAFMLAIETVSPLIAEQMKNLQSIANTINQTNINSCEMGASLVGGLWPKMDIAQKHVCESIGTSSNLFSDWAAARQGCGAGGQRASTFAHAKDNDPLKGMIAENVNLAWRAIQKNGFLAKDLPLAELMMSLSGSLIIKRTGTDDNSSPKLIPLFSLSTDPRLLNALMHGGEATIYHCLDTDTVNCLDVKEQTITIDATHALGSRVRNLLQDMVSKIQTDTELTVEEIGLLQATPLPVYKMLNVNVAYAKGSPVLDVPHYADIIASDILYQYLSENLELVRLNSTLLALPEDILNHFQKGIQQARLQVAEERRKTHATMNSALEMIQQVRVLEQQLSGALSVDLASP